MISVLPQYLQVEKKVKTWWEMVLGGYIMKAQLASRRREGAIYFLPFVKWVVENETEQLSPGPGYTMLAFP